MNTSTRNKHPILRFIRGLTRIVAALLMLALALTGASLLWACLVGFPPAVIERVERVFKDWEVDVRIGRLYWQWPCDLRAEQVTYYSDDDPVTPLITVRRLETRLRPVGFFRDGWPLNLIRATGGLIRLPAYEGPLLADSPSNLLLSEIAGNVRLHPDFTIGFEGMAGFLQGIPFRADGAFVVPDDSDPERSLYAQWLGLYVSGPDAPMPGWIADLVAEFSATRFNHGQNRIEAVFNIHPTILDENRVSLRADGSLIQGRGLTVTNWHLLGSLEGQTYAISNAVFQLDNGSTLQADAACLVTQDVVRAQVVSQWPVAETLALLPGSVSHMFAGWEFSFGPACAFTLRLGPAPITNALDTIQAAVNLCALRFQTIPFEDIRLVAEWDGEGLWINECSAATPSMPAPGNFSANGVVYPLRQQYAIRFNTQMQPSHLLPICPPALSNYIGRYSFTNLPPRVEASLTGSWDSNAPSLVCKGQFDAEQFLVDDVPLLSVQSKLLVNDDVILLDEIQATRAEGALTGSITLPFGRDEAVFDVQSHMDPAAVAEFISPVLYDILEPFEFRGASSVHAAGSIDYLIRTQMHFRVEVQTDNMALFKLHLDRARFTVVGEGDEFRASDFLAETCKGDIRGNLVFFPVDDDLLRYNLDAAYSNLSLKCLVEQISHNVFTNVDSADFQEGITSGDLLLSGVTSSNWLSELSIRGNIRIEQSSLLSISLFGPLSRWLSRISPNLGYLTQTGFEAPFSIHDGILYLDNAQLSGNALRIFFTGTCNLDTHELDFRVQVRFLRQSLFARLVNFVTYPITKLLLEFKLSGTLTEPVWRPVNIPKELYFDFK